MKQRRWNQKGREAQRVGRKILDLNRDQAISELVERQLHQYCLK